MQRQNRLTQSRQFSFVYHRGKSAGSKELVLLFGRGNQKRVGFSVSKKVGNAVTRNLVRRRLRECVRQELPQLKNGLYVFVVRPAAADCSYAQLQKSVHYLFRKLALYQAPQPSQEQKK